MWKRKDMIKKIKRPKRKDQTLQKYQKQIQNINFKIKSINMVSAPSTAINKIKSKFRTKKKYALPLHNIIGKTTNPFPKQ